MTSIPQNFQPEPRSAPLRFGAREPKTIVLAVGFVLLFGVTAFCGMAHSMPQNEPSAFGDFFGAWAFAKFVMAMAPEQIYDPAILGAFHAQMGAAPDIVPRCFYPPIFVLLLWPLGLLPIAQAYVIWVAGTLASYLIAVGAYCRKSLLVLGALVAPTTLVTALTGQNGFLSAALLLGGWRLVSAHPLSAGVLFGLLTYKPQLGILVPIALASAGCWRAMASAIVTTLLLVVASSAAFGVAMWPAWLASIPENWQLLAEPVVKLNVIMPTVTANLLILGIPPGVGRIIQVAVAIVVAIIIWRLFRRGPAPLAVAALLAGTFLTTPYALVYDLPVLTAAVLLFIGERVRTDTSFGPGELAILALAFTLPLIMPAIGAYVPISLIAVVSLFALIVLSHRGEEAARGLQPARPYPA
jgi:hypothetical protein